MSIPSWSHSRLATFEQCKYRAFLLFDQKVQEPERPLPPGRAEHANDRGTRVHQGCEDYVSGKTSTMPAEARKNFGPELEELRFWHQHGIVSLEGEWGMSRDWEPWDWRGQWTKIPLPAGEAFQKVKTLPQRASAGEVYLVGKEFWTWIPAWLRLKVDALIFETDYTATVIDYKTGKKFGNELKHGEQLQLYQLVTFLRYPKLEEITTELWYFDADELTKKTFTRDQGLRFQRNWDKRGNNITTATHFPPNPNHFTCKWCFLGERDGGAGICKSGKW